MKESECQKVMKVARNKMGASNGTHTEGVAPRPRETFEGSHGTLFPPPVVTRNKHTDCPQNPAHLKQTSALLRRDKTKAPNSVKQRA